LVRTHTLFVRVRFARRVWSELAPRVPRYRKLIEKLAEQLTEGGSSGVHTPITMGVP
jgi:hypothetical protein